MFAAFPKTMIDGAGRNVCLNAAPQRVVSMAPSITEMVCAVGAEDRLVGVTRYCAFPDSVKRKSIVGGGYDPDYERIVSLKPDLVLLTHMADTRFARQFERLGLRTLILHPEGLSSVMDDIRLIGDALGEPERAHKEVSRLQSALDDRARALKKISRDNARVPMLLLYRADNLLAAGKGSFAGDILDCAGGENLANETGIPWPQLNKEYLLAADPEIVCIVQEGFSGPIRSVQKNHALLKRWQSDPVFGRLSAVKNERLYELDGRLFLYPGPRLDQALAQLSSVIDAYFAEGDFSGNNSDAPTDSPNSSATIPSDHSIGM